MERGRKKRVEWGVKNMEEERERRRKMGLKVEVEGEKGNVGREMINIIEERGFKEDEVVKIE